MWIKGVHVDGFGVFCDADLKPLAPGLTVFLGQNEAGKSTTLDFFRAMFFGFPRKNSVSRKQREPLAGGRHGGSLLLVEGEREVTLARAPGPHGGTVSLVGADGAPLPEAELTRLLGGVTESFFCHVHAFSLDELQMAGKDDILAQLYGAGTGVGLALAQAEKRFERELADRFAPGGQNPRINQLLKRFELLGEELRTAREQTTQYARLEEEIAALTATLEESQVACDTLGRRQRLLRALRDHWQEWVEILDAEQRLRELPETPAETPADERDLERVLHAAAAAEEAARERTERVEALRGEIASVQIDERLTQRCETIRALARQAGEYESARTRLPLVEQEAEQARQALADRLRLLGPDWTPERVSACDRSIAVRGEIDAHAEALATAERALHDAENRSQALADELRQAEEKGKEAEGQEARAAAAAERFPAAVCGWLRSERDRLVALARRLPDLRRDGERLRREVAEQARSIDVTWDAGHLLAFDTSAVARERLQQARERLARADREEEAASHALAEARQQLERLGEPSPEAPAAPEEGEIRERRRDLRRLAQAVTERDALSRMPSPPVLGPYLLPVLGALALLFLVLAEMVHTAYLAGLLLPAAGAALAWRFGRRQPGAANAAGSGEIAALCARLELVPASPDFDAAEKRLDEQQAQAQAVREQARLRQEAEERMRHAHHAQEAAARQIRQTRADWDRQVAALGFSGQPSPGTVLDLCAAIAEGQRRAAEAERIDRTVAESEASLADAWRRLRDAEPPQDLPEIFVPEALDRLLAAQDEATREQREAAARREQAGTAVAERRNRHAESERIRVAAAEALDQAREAWRQWLDRRGLHAELTPGTAREAFVAIGQAWDQMQALARLETEAQRHRRTCADIEARLAEILEDLGREPASAAPHPALLALAEENEGNAARQAAVEELRKQETKAGAALRRAETHRDESATALASFVRGHGAADIGQLRAHIETARRRREAQALRDGHLRSLRTALGTPDAETVRAAFAETEQTALPTELAQVEEALATSETQRETARDARARKLHELDALMSSDRIACLRQEQEAVRAEINALALEWARARLARQLLEEAKRTFERERQPQVLKEASVFFHLLTCGRFAGVFSPLGGDRELRALLPGGEARSPEELSRGTVEQLYLSLRFGFLASAAQQGAVLPVMMDEILVNFDPERAAATARAIGQLSRTHQTLFFTCHPAMAELLRSQAGAALVQIREGQFVHS